METGRRQVQADTVALSWRIRERPGGLVVEFFGEVDEHADFRGLLDRMRGNVTFELGEVRRLNSSGVREWVNFVRELEPAVTELTLSACSPAIVTQLNMIRNFRGPARIRSFLAPYVCGACGHEEEKLLDVRAHFADHKLDRMPGFLCEECQGPMEFDDLPERYLAFLEDEWGTRKG
jgi:eukaryotic-like serine/threonine-protein kinase